MSFARRAEKKRIGKILGGDEGAVLGGKEGAVFAHLPIGILSFRIERHVAEEDGDVLRRCDDLLAAGFTFSQKGGLLPRIAQEMAGNGKRGKEDEVSTFLSRQLDIVADGIGVFVRLARDHGDLSQSNLDHGVSFSAIGSNRCGAML